MNDIPHYLKSKLETLDINSMFHVKQFNAVKLFQQLKLHYSSLSYNTLYDLYCMCNDLPINSLDANSKRNLVKEYKALLPCYKLISSDKMQYYMNEASHQADLAITQQEIPIGAIVVYNNEIIARGYNKTLMSNDITQHAEIVALQQAQALLGNHILDECDLYVTIEPCLMCSGALINSRIRRVIFGACELKTGAICSQYAVFSNSQVNNHTQVIGPLDNTLYAKQLQQFFDTRRGK